MNKKCPYCRSINTKVFYDSRQPLIIRAIDKDISKQVGSKMLKYSHCEECDLVFSVNPPTDKEMHQIYNYYNFIKPSLGLGNTKFEKALNYLQEIIKSKNINSVLEIGSDDGFVLNRISQLTKIVKGCDPSPATDFAKQKYNLDIRKEYFYSNLFEEKFDLIYMLHVFEHLPNPFSFLDKIKAELNDAGYLFLEFPSLAEVLEKGILSTFIHEHTFLYSKYFIYNLAHEKDFNVIFYDDSKGVTNILLKLNIRGENNNIKEKEKVTPKIDDFSKKVNENIEKLKSILSDNENILIWGAGSLSTVMFNQVNLNFQTCTFVDGDKSKQGKYIPGIDKEVKDINMIDHNKTYNLIIASSFVEEILKNIDEDTNIKLNNIFQIYPIVKEIDVDNIV